MRISDWSSDVCSSDLEHDGVPVLVVVDLRGGGVHPAAVVHLLLHLHRRAGELDHLLAVAAADVRLRRLDIEPALGDVDAARPHPPPGLRALAVSAGGGTAQPTDPAGGLSPSPIHRPYSHDGQK